MARARPHPPTGVDAHAYEQGLFDRAVVYWNAGAFFEAHEDWETLWNDAEGPRRAWLQGLIQFAAGFHHVDHGTASGFSKLMRTASAKAGPYAGDTHGIDFARLWADLEPWIAHGERVAAGAPVRPGAPEAFPTIVYKPGVVPMPAAPDDEDDA
jgi:uncharacterized protein